MIPPLIHSAALAGLENVINRALQLDPSSASKLAALENNAFALELTEPDLAMSINIASGQLHLSHGVIEQATTTLKGHWGEFAKIASAADPAAALINGNVVITGDTAPILELRRLLSELDIDWEQPLADAFGDVAAHQIGSGLRAGQRWIRSASKNLRRQLEDFLLEESQLVPHPYQTENFYTELEDVSARTERLEAKVRRLQQRLTKI